MDQFRLHIAVPYDSKNNDHEGQLLQLWKLSFPDKQLEARVSAQWKTLGFQGTDPMTDFRGAGIFGLNNLLYFAETYPNRYLTVKELICFGQYIDSVVLLKQHMIIDCYNITTESPIESHTIQLPCSD
jgi:hypothetical protein